MPMAESSLLDGFDVTLVPKGHWFSLKLVSYPLSKPKEAKICPNKISNEISNNKKTEQNK